jgi:hypothetical protein
MPLRRADTGFPEYPGRHYLTRIDARQSEHIMRYARRNRQATSGNAA